MIKIKFIQFYSGLVKKDKKEFKKAVDSGFFNKGRNYLDFLDAVEKLLSRSSDSNELIKLLSEHLSLNSRSIWNRFAELNKIAEKYISIKEMENNLIEKNYQVSSYFINTSRYDLFLQKTKQTLKLFKRTEKGVESNYLYYRHLQQLGNYFIFQSKNEPFIANINEQVIYHSASYIINHYLHLTELLQQRNITAGELAEKGLNFLTDSDIENFIHSLEKINKNLFSEVSFHYYIYKAFLLKNDDSFYRRSLKYFEIINKTASETYRTMMYQMLINYCIARTNRGDSGYYTELFRIYNQKLKEGLVQDLKVGNFPINNFRDYIFVALQLGKIDWIKWFIENYSSLLPVNVRKDEINLSYGIVHYNELNYKQAVISLNKVAGDNYIHYMDSKYYKLRIYFETQQYEEALMETDNYKHYLRSHKEIPDSFIKPYRVFIKEYLILLNGIIKNKTENAELLYNHLSKINLSPRRKWIYNKLKILLKI